jgi:hypothetical protein
MWTVLLKSEPYQVGLVQEKTEGLLNYGFVILQRDADYVSPLCPQ